MLRIALICLNDMRLLKDSWSYRRAIVFRCVFVKGGDMRWNNSAFLGFAQEDVLGVLGCNIQPIGVVECSTVEADSTFEALKCQIQLRPAGVAEMNIDFLSTPFGYVSVTLRFALKNLEIGALEYRFN